MNAGPREIATILCLAAGMVFFAGALAGLLRFPDSASRLHALTKADNLGLGFVVAGLIIHRAWDLLQLKLLLVYALALGAAAMNGYLIGQRCLRESRAEDGDT